MFARSSPAVLLGSLLLLVAPTAGAQQIQSLEHDPSFGTQGSLVHVSGDVYALAYRGGTQPSGVIKTFTISADGTIITEVQSLEHDTGDGSFNSLVHVSGDVYALAYANASLQGVLKTFTISSDGTAINQLQQLPHDSLGRFNSLVHVDADIFALAYTGSANDGFLKTFSIAANGSSITELETLEHDAADGTYNSLVRIDADTCALAYAGPSEDGFLKTFTISADGLTVTEVQSLEHDAVLGRHSSLVQVSAGVYALAYSGVSGGQDGLIKTFQISADGSTISQLQALAHDPIKGEYNSLVQVDADTVALAYSGEGDDGVIKTFAISADGLAITEVDSLEHDSVNGTHGALARSDGGTFVLAYAGEDEDGFVKTFGIDGSGGLPVVLQQFSID